MSVCLSISPSVHHQNPLRIAPINHLDYWPSILSTMKPIDHLAYPSSLLTIEPIDQRAYLLTIEPINRQAYWPSSLSTIESIDLWSSFAFSLSACFPPKQRIATTKSKIIQWMSIQRCFAMFLLCLLLSPYI